MAKSIFSSIPSPGSPRVHPTSADIDFDTISQFSIVNNGMDSTFDMENEEVEISHEDGIDDEGDGNVDGDDIEEPSSFTNLERIDVANVDN
ncbi:hypothetical protein L2E82_33028 [Cichorium intybus]|uniref:Uncharacterized protein n=1 Tax=Cichorium intybus TaxID=13427 RepID=A0ACB9BIW4_CICIN|nr:hypothetical protein L2E82_33028 [Cichorium intybus]